MRPYCLVDRHQYFEERYCFLLQGIWRQHVLPKCWYLLTRLYGIMCFAGIYYIFMTREGSLLLQHSWYLPTQKTTNVSKCVSLASIVFSQQLVCSDSESAVSDRCIVSSYFNLLTAVNSPVTYYLSRKVQWNNVKLMTS